MLAVPSLKPPALTLVAVWQPEPLQSRRPDRDVVARGADDGDVGEGRRDRGSVTAQALRHPLVGAGDGVERVVARGGVALRARRTGRDVVRGLAGTGDVAGEGRRGGVAAAAVATRRMLGIERRGGTRVAGGGAAARQHPHVRSGLVAGLAGGDRRGHRRVAGDAERRGGDARAAEFEAARIDVGRCVAAGAVAVEAADRDVVARRADDRDVGEGRRRRRGRDR